MPEFSESGQEELFRMLTSSTWAKFLTILLESANRHRKNILSGTLTEEQYYKELAKLTALKTLLADTYGTAKATLPINIASVFE